MGRGIGGHGRSWDNPVVGQQGKSVKNIFVMGLEPFNLELLQTIRGDERLRFHTLFEHDEVVHSPDKGYPPLDLLVKRADEAAEKVPGGMDAVIGYWDFPTSCVVPMIARHRGLPGPTLESVGRCEHKYWSRLEQRGVVPEYVPRFQAIDPFADDPLKGLELDYPFWLKPVKAHSSFLGFYIDSAERFDEHLDEIRQKIGLMGDSFNEFLSHVDLPEQVREVDGNHCIAEEIIASGGQCTLEGYSWNGKVDILGIVDSVRSGKHRSSFTRYQYPSKLPRRVQARIIETSSKVMRHLGYDGAAFNIEYFWNADSGRLSLLEINARISKSHSPLFLMVDGATNQKAIVDLALGRKPDFPHRQGVHKVAAKFMLRYFKDGILERVPTEDDIERLKSTFSEAQIRLVAPEGVRLSDLKMQDSYSYEVAEVFLGAASQKDLLERYRQALDILNFHVRPLGRKRASGEKKTEAK